MYNETREKIVDRREMLRIKLKSLAEETRIIRTEEKRTFGALRDEMHAHRILVVRKHARATHIAYALIKGRTMAQIEGNAYFPPDWEAVDKMLKKYGEQGKKYDLPS